MVTVNLTPAVLVFNAVALDPDPGVVTIQLAPAVLNFSGVAVDPDPGPVTTTLVPAVLTFGAVPLDPDPGPVIVNLVPAVLTFGAIPLSPTGGGGPSVVDLIPAVLSFTAITLLPPAMGGALQMAYQQAVELKDCILARLATDGLPAPARACVTVGEIAWDECPCGQLAVSLTELFPSETFPTFTLAPTVRCPPKLTVAHYVIELVRCANTGSDMSPPTCQALAVDALLAIQDGRAVRAGITCCLDQAVVARSIVDYTLGRQVMIGPQGGCVGSRTDLYIAFMACGCTPGGI